VMLSLATLAATFVSLSWNGIPGTHEMLWASGCCFGD
jgi:hypothetical protein